MFLLTPKPIDGESLSSWRQRLGMANGFRLFPLAPGELRRSDPDIAPSEATLAWIAKTHGVSIEKLIQMTAAGKFETLQGLSMRGSRRWIVSMQYSRLSHRRFGMPFCPICLTDDTTPHFRLHWRSCLNSHCHLHGVLLSDVCFRCGSAAWPAMCVSRTAYQTSWAAPHICCMCGADFRQVPAPEKVVCVQQRNASHLGANQLIELNRGVAVSAKSYGDAVWIICQIFMRTRSASRVAKHHQKFVPLIANLQAHRARCVEELPIHLRHQLTHEVHGLFVEWPRRLLEFCAQAQISAEHFSQDRKNCPIWLEDFIRENLCIQSRGISVEHVVKVVESLSKSGSPLSKASVSRLLGATSSKAIDEVLGQRTVANLEEAMQFMSQLASWADEKKTRDTSTEIRLRNALILLLSIYVGAPTVDIATWSKSQCLSALTKKEGEVDSHAIAFFRCANLIEQLMTRYGRRKRFISSSGEDAESNFFRGFRGAAVPQRSVQQTVAIGMRSLDPRLVRSVSVFRL